MRHLSGVIVSNKIQVIIEALNRTDGGVKAAMASLKQMTNAATALSAEFLAIKFAVQQAFDMIAKPIQAAMTAVEDYQSAVVKTAATITSFQGSKGDIGENYRKATEYAEALQEKLEEIDSRTIASAQDLGLITDEMLKQRVVLDINNQKQIEGFANLANAVATVTAGSGAKEIQIRQEVRALMQGQVDAQSQLASQVNAMVGGGLKQKVELWKQEGTLVENIGGLLVGYAAASGDLSSLWSTIKSTMETILNQVLRGGFADAFKEIVAAAQRLNEWAKEHKGDLQQMVNRGWLLIKGTLEIILNLFKPLLKSSGDMGEIVSGILRGLGYVAYAVLPVLATRVGEIAAGMFEWIKMAFNLGKLLWQAFSFDWEGVKQTWGDIQKNFTESGAHAGKAFQEGFFKEIGERAADFDQTFSSSKKTAATPDLGKAPATKDQVQEARAAEEAKLRLQLENLRVGTQQQASSLRTRAAEVEAYHKAGILNEREYLEWKQQLQEEAVSLEIDLLRKQEQALKASWERRKSLFFSDEGKEQTQATGAVAAELKKIEGEIAAKREELSVIGIKGRIEQIEYSRKLSQAERDGVLKNLETEISLQRQKNDLLAAQGLLSPLEYKEREIALEKQLLQVKIQKLEIDREQASSDADAVSKKAEIDSLRQQLAGLDVKGAIDRADYGSLNEGLKKGFRDFAETARQNFRSGTDMARDAAGSMQQAFADGFFDVMQTKFNSLGKYVLNFLQSVQRAIANFFAQQATNALISSIGNFATSFFGSYTGGTGGGLGGSSFSVSPTSTAYGSYTLHKGGLVPRFHFGGLASDEVPAILQTRERVLSREQNEWFERFTNKAENSGGVNVKINIENQTGQPMDAKTGNMRFDGEGYVIGVVLKALTTSPSFRSAVRG